MFKISYATGFGWYIAKNGRFFDGYFANEWLAIEVVEFENAEAGAELRHIHSSVE